MLRQLPPLQILQDRRHQTADAPRHLDIAIFIRTGEKEDTKVRESRPVGGMADAGGQVPWWQSKNWRQVWLCWRWLCCLWRTRVTVLPVKFGQAGECKMLLVQSSKHKDKWTLPGGGVDPGESVEQAVHRELLEEAGVRGVLGLQLGLYHDRDKRTRTVAYSLIVQAVQDEWDESFRSRRWFEVPSREAEAALETKPRNLAIYRRFLETLPRTGANFQRGEAL
eukprot:g2065.t1